MSLNIHFTYIIYYFIKIFLYMVDFKSFSILNNLVKSINDDT